MGTCKEWMRPWLPAGLPHSHLVWFMGGLLARFYKCHLLCKVVTCRDVNDVEVKVKSMGATVYVRLERTMHCKLARQTMQKPEIDQRKVTIYYALELKLQAASSTFKPVDTCLSLLSDTGSDQ